MNVRPNFLHFVLACAILMPLSAGCGGSSTPEDVCVTTTACTTNDDCPEMQHCNLNLVPPTCQTLFCGELGSACSEPALCQYQYCPLGYCGCERDCSETQCGPDPVCGLSCGICDDGFACEDGRCVSRPCVPDCTGLVCGLDPVCATSCGTCDDGWECSSGACVEIPVENEMVTVPAGSFWMGCDDAADSNCNTDSQPYHLVNLDAFRIDRTEVTLAQYADCYNAGACTAAYWDLKDGCNWGDVTKINHPVTCVDWDQATAYCEWLGKRLPTEAEWEKAARGGVVGRRFPWSDADTITHSRANYFSSTDYVYDVSLTRGYHPSFQTGATPYTSPVGYFAPNGYDLYDMAGNVYEWCWDWYDASWYSNAGATQSDTRGPTTGTSRLIRGGYWHYGANNLRCAYRYGYSQSSADGTVGFRCARGL